MFNIDKASIYYEVAGTGQPLLFIHAGVADSRQWNNEFETFAPHYRVIRYDLRGFGKSKPAAGEYSHLQDLTALIEHLGIARPIIIIGCSMGGGLALDFTLANPGKVSALIMVDSAPAGLQLDVRTPEKFKDIQNANKKGDLDLVAELETQIWFDGDRKPTAVDQDMRKLAYEMNRLALSHDATGIGKQIPNTKELAVNNIGKLDVPLLAILGIHDIPYMHAAIDYMDMKIPGIKTKIIDNAAHLPNMDQPIEFRDTIMGFLSELSTRNL